MTSLDFPEGGQVGAWRVWPRAGRLTQAGIVRSLEPKVMDVLTLLAARAGEVVTHEEMLAALWPDTIVGDDTLARSVSKLRRALHDDVKTPAYVETIPKRGYRLIAEVRRAAAPEPVARRWPSWAGAAAIAVALIAVVLIAALVWSNAERQTDIRIARATDHYYQYTRADNETAIALYEQVLATEPDDAEALAGIAAALVQRALRWPNPPGGEEFSRTSLGEALASGRTQTAQSQAWLVRARLLSSRAVAQNPRSAFVYQARGLALAASGDFGPAEDAYRRALEIDPDAWGALINLGELSDIRGASSEALPIYQRAYDAMERAYPTEPQRVRHWQNELGAVIAERYAAADDTATAETWFRRVLSRTPLHERSVVGLATLLKQKGDADGAARLCSGLLARNASAACEALMQT